MNIRLVAFLLLNFAALALGGLSTGDGVVSEWYLGLAKAPWTPPGWVFGAAWTTIMICFSFYMARLWQVREDRNFLAVLYGVQWLLNVGWNPVFFTLQLTLAGLFIISGLTLLVGFLLFRFWSELKLTSLFILPYFLWLLIATSLNTYILVMN